MWIVDCGRSQGITALCPQVVGKSFAAIKQPPQGCGILDVGAITESPLRVWPVVGSLLGVRGLRGGATRPVVCGVGS